MLGWCPRRDSNSRPSDYKSDRSILSILFLLIFFILINWCVQFCVWKTGIADE